MSWPQIVVAIFLFNNAMEGTMASLHRHWPAVRKLPHGRWRAVGCALALTVPFAYNTAVVLVLHWGGFW